MTDATDTAAERELEDLAELVSALAAAQAAFAVPKRSRNVNTGTYQYAYADLSDVLAAVVPALTANGIALGQDARVDLERKTITITTTLRRRSALLTFGPLELPIARVDVQGIGSAETYGRRYQLSTALGVAAGEDDDGASASRPAAKPERASAATMKRLHALAKRKGVSHEAMRDWAGKHLGIETLAELTPAGAADMESSLAELPDAPHDAGATVDDGAERAGGGSDGATLGRVGSAGAPAPTKGASS